MSAPNPHAPRGVWSMDTVLHEVPVGRPLLASWESKAHPAQVRLQAPLTDLRQAVGDLSGHAGDLGLEFLIDVEEPGRLTHHYNLVNYLTPIVNSIGAGSFRYVRARKRVGGGSTLRIFTTQEEADVPDDSWQHLEIMMRGSSAGRPWKEALIAALQNHGSGLLPPGEVAVVMAWATNPRRNWTNLWKTTADAMGPVLGYETGSREFSPNDDRITALDLHLHTDARLGHEVMVRLWWKSASR